VEEGLTLLTTNLLFCHHHPLFLCFQNQYEAVEALAKTLEPLGWKLIIRRHPYGEIVPKEDPEVLNWKFLDNLPNVIMIPPESRIDSYALGQEADCVAYFNSSIGAEFIYLQSTPVLSMGPTSWDKRNLIGKARTSDAVSNFFASDMPLPDRGIIMPWAYFGATGGSKFSYLHEGHNGNWYLNEFRLHEPFGEWVNRLTGMRKFVIKYLILVKRVIYI
jgi:hypothetical protein